MNFEALQTQWANYDQKLEANLRLNQKLLRDSVLSKTNSALQRLTRSIVVELFVGLATAIVLGLFIGAHLGEPLFLLPAILLHVFVIFQVAFDGYQWNTLRNLDFSAPIPEAQKKLARLRVQRIQVAKWTLWVAPLLWVPLLIVSFKGLFGLDVYATFSTPWLIANVLFGVAVIPLMIGLSRRYADRMNRSPRVQRLMDDIAGRDLTEAKAFVDELSNFDKE
jgi:hypothetical protein